jgi:hypothetical protein
MLIFCCTSLCIRGYRCLSPEEEEEEEEGGIVALGVRLVNFVESWGLDGICCFIFFIIIIFLDCVQFDSGNDLLSKLFARW